MQNDIKNMPIIEAETLCRCNFLTAIKQEMQDIEDAYCALKKNYDIPEILDDIIEQAQTGTLGVWDILREIESREMLKRAEAHITCRAAMEGIFDELARSENPRELQDTRNRNFVERRMRKSYR